MTILTGTPAGTAVAHGSQYLISGDRAVAEIEGAGRLITTISEHPLNVNLREDAVIGHVDQWLACEFALHRLSETIHDLAAAWQSGTIRAGNGEEPRARSPGATAS